MSASRSIQLPVLPQEDDAFIFFVSWFCELEQLHHGGMIDDEDYAYQRAEKLAELMNCPRRPWLAWVYIGLPITLIGAALTWQLLANIELSAALFGAGSLCSLAALSRRSRERFANLRNKDRLLILRELLATDLLTCAEFSDCEEQLLTGKRNRFPR